MLRDDFNLPIFLSILGNFKINRFWKPFSGQVIYHLSQSAEKRCIFMSSILKAFPAFCKKETLGLPGIEPATFGWWARRYITSAIQTWLSEWFNFLKSFFSMCKKWFIILLFYWKLTNFCIQVTSVALENQHQKI